MQEDLYPAVRVYLGKQISLRPSPPANPVHRGKENPKGQIGFQCTYANFLSRLDCPTELNGTREADWLIQFRVART